MFPIIYFETYKDSGEEEDTLLLEMNFLLRITMAREIDPTLLNFLESSLSSVLQRFEHIVSREYQKNKNISILTLHLHMLLHVVFYIRKCGNLRTFISPPRDKVIKLMKGYNRPQSQYIQAIMNHRSRAVLAQSLIPLNFSFQTGHCKFLVELDKFPEITTSWDSMSIYEQMSIIQHMFAKGVSSSNMRNLGATARIFSILNCQVWKYFTDLYNSPNGFHNRICLVDSNNTVLAYPSENDIFLRPEHVQRYASCSFHSHGQTILHKSVVRLNSPVNGTSSLLGQSRTKPRYVYVHEFFRVTLHLHDEVTQQVSVVEKDMVLFTEIEDGSGNQPATSVGNNANPNSEFFLKRNILKPCGIQVQDAFEPNNTSDINREPKGLVNYGYYYTVEFTADEATKLWDVVANEAVNAVKLKKAGSSVPVSDSFLSANVNANSNNPSNIEGSVASQPTYVTLGYFNSYNASTNANSDLELSTTLPGDGLGTEQFGAICNTTHSSTTSSNASIFNFPPPGSNWGVSPIEDVSNPVLSVPVLSKDRRAVNVHLYDPRLEGSLIMPETRKPDAYTSSNNNTTGGNNSSNGPSGDKEIF